MGTEALVSEYSIKIKKSFKITWDLGTRKIFKNQFFICGFPRSFDKKGVLKTSHKALVPKCFSTSFSLFLTFCEHCFTKYT